MKEQRIITKKFDVMCDAISDWKKEIAQTLQKHKHPFYIPDDMREDRNMFVRVVEDERAVHCVVDMVRSDDGINIMAHKISWNYMDVDEWMDISSLGEEAEEQVIENILWLTKEDLMIVATDCHDGNLIDIVNHSDVNIYFVHQHDVGSVNMQLNGMVELVRELDDFDGVSGWFGVHRYDWSQACKDVDNHYER